MNMCLLSSVSKFMKSLFLLLSLMHFMIDFIGNQSEVEVICRAATAVLSVHTCLCYPLWCGAGPKKLTGGQRLSVGRFIDNSKIGICRAGCSKIPAGESVGEKRGVGGEVAHCGTG